MLKWFYRQIPKALLTWIRRHHTQILFVLACMLAVTVATFSDIDEKFPWGHEFGILVSELAFAYVGAYVFNWLIVELPRQKAFRDYYKTARMSLLRLGSVPISTVQTIYMLADRAQERPETADAAALREQVERLDLPKLKAEEGVDVIYLLRSLVEKHRDAYRSLAPLLNNFETSVAVRIARLDGVGIHRFVDSSSNLQVADVLSFAGARSTLTELLYEYQEAGKELRQALDESPYVEHFDDWGNLLGKGTRNG